MPNNKDQYIAIQNLKEYIELELLELGLKEDEEEYFLNILSNEILTLKTNNLNSIPEIAQT